MCYYMEILLSMIFLPETFSRTLSCPILMLYMMYQNVIHRPVPGTWQRDGLMTVALSPVFLGLEVSMYMYSRTCLNPKPHGPLLWLGFHLGLEVSMYMCCPGKVHSKTSENQSLKCRLNLNLQTDMTYKFSMPTVHLNRKENLQVWRVWEITLCT